MAIQSNEITTRDSPGRKRRSKQKALFALSVFLILSVLLTGCSADIVGSSGAEASSLAQTQSLTLSDYSEDQFIQTEGVFFQTFLQSYPTDSDVFSWWMVNNTDEELRITQGIQVEVENNGKWYRIPFPDWIEPFDTDQYITIYANNQFINSFETMIGDYKNCPGHYRLIAQVYGSKNAYMSEFVIRADAAKLSLKEILRESPFDNVCESDDAISITIDPSYSVTPTGAWQLDYTVTNNSVSTISFGQTCYFEVLIDNTWFSMPIAGADAVAYYLAPNESCEYQAFILTDTFNWPEGEYRLVKPISLTEPATSSSLHTVGFLL